MATLAYSPGKREIKQYFTIHNAKLVSLAVVALLLVGHTAWRHYYGWSSSSSFAPLSAAAADGGYS